MGCLVVTVGVGAERRRIRGMVGGHSVRIWIRLPGTLLADRHYWSPLASDRDWCGGLGGGERVSASAAVVALRTSNISTRSRFPHHIACGRDPAVILSTYSRMLHGRGSPLEHLALSHRICTIMP